MIVTPSSAGAHRPAERADAAPQRVEGPLFETVLVANRGEIARRVIRTLRRLGIRSVAVYSDADAAAPHVREADEAVRIGPAAASASYLSIDAVLAAARATGAQAVHPGYGFLSENADFARACAAAGIVFVGPGELALDVMGDKIRSKEHVSARGVPTVPGFSAAGMTDRDIAAAAAATGYPLLIKPSAGGGGKGMQIVRDAAGLGEALATARRVAAAAFGDDTLLLERLIERPRHIEVQVLADAQGGVIHLGERECTLQRRHQKVIEEAPSSIVDAETRERLGAAACAAAASVEYVGVGTVEFLVAADHPEDFFFIEMNTRLQVEHPVTELVTGIDLVEQQLRVAAGHPLDRTQGDVRLRGHAVEARVYAEAPERGFLPATGTVIEWRDASDAAYAVASGGPGVSDVSGATVADAIVRVDSAVETGSVVSSDYDPMIAKVIAWAPERGAALSALDAALADTVVLGVDTNIAFLRALVSHPAVVAGDLDTGLIDRLPPFEAPEPEPVALSAAATAMAIGLAETGPRAETGDYGRGGPAPAMCSAWASALWASGSGWRAGAPARPRIFTFETDGGTIVRAPATALGDDALVGGRAAPAAIRVAIDTDGAIWVHADGATHRLRPLTRRQAQERRLAARTRTHAATRPELLAPMPGTVVAVHVVDGDAVAAGDRIVTIEAMKMEHSVTAPHAGAASVSVAVGDRVSRDQVLARVIADAEHGEDATASTGSATAATAATAATGTAGATAATAATGGTYPHTPKGTP